MVGYRALTHVPLLLIDESERETARHRRHLLALVAPFVVFSALVGLPWNSIYRGIVAMALGAAAAVLCRPDLWRSTLFGGVIFLGLYTVFLLGLKWLWPGYIEAVWNLDDLLGWRLGTAFGGAAVRLRVRHVLEQRLRAPHLASNAA